MPQLRSSLADLVNRGEKQLVVDLSRVTFCDSTTLGVFVSTHRRISELGGSIEFHAPPDAVRNLLFVSGLDQVLHVS